MTKVNKTAEYSKLEALNKYLNKHYQTRRCAITGHLYIKNTTPPSSNWQRLENTNTLLHRVRRNVAYETSRGLSSCYGIEFLEQLLASEDFSPTFNPLHDYFASLKAPSDPQEAFNAFMRCLVLSNETAEEVAYVKAAVTKWAVSAVRSVFEPRFTPKQILLLRSTEETIGKTSFINRLVPPCLAEYTAALGDISPTNKDAQLQLTNKFIIQLDEIDLFLKSPTNRQMFKSYVTTEAINIRLPYARHDTYKPRIASFIGTCNEYEFLGGSVGTSRFMVINLDNFVNNKYIKSNKLTGLTPAEEFDVDAFWGSAYALYKHGYDSQLNNEELEQLKQRNQMHQFACPVTELLMSHFKPSNKADGEFLSSSDIIKELQQVDTFIPITPVKMGLKLNKNGFKKTAVKRNGITRYGYFVKRLNNNDNTQWVTKNTINH